MDLTYRRMFKKGKRNNLDPVSDALRIFVGDQDVYSCTLNEKVTQTGQVVFMFWELTRDTHMTKYMWSSRR